MRTAAVCRHVVALLRTAGSPRFAGRQGSLTAAQRAMANATSQVGVPDGPIARLLYERITAALAPAHLELENESHKHSVPPGSESHFKVFIVSPAFEGVPLIQRHRLVHDAVKGGSGTAELPIHALSVSAKTPAQWASGAGMQTTPNCRGGGAH